LVLALGLVAVAAGLRFLPGSPFARGGANAAPPLTAQTPEATATPTPEPEPLPFRSAEVTATTLKTKGFVSWALLDRRTGEIVGSTNLAQRTTTMSMIKAWLAADSLRRNPSPSATRLRSLEIMIRDSNNEVADQLYTTSSITRLVDVCDLQDSRPAPNGRFGYTQISARDAVRMGACIADGRAAGTKWTPWVLDMMRKVRGVGDFGIREVMPAAQQPQIAIKNGWDSWSEDNTFRTNCLAIGDTWVVSVMQRYPTQGDANLDLAHTKKICLEAARLLLNPEAN
jgi:hypothetical protein